VSYFFLFKIRFERGSIMRRTAFSLVTGLTFFAFAAVSSANIVEIAPGEQGSCENASWVVYNLSETEETNIEFDIGPYAYAWEKVHTATLAPGGYETNAMAAKTTVTNKGPGRVSLNCQRQRFDRHDWKIDAGSGKTYQGDYHLDHTTPGTYLEPGLGLPQGTERGIGAVMGDRSEGNR